MKILAYDTAYPTNKVMEFVTVTVNRNAFSPIFGDSAYTKIVADNYPLVTEVIKVAATDGDGVSTQPVLKKKNTQPVLVKHISFVKYCINMY